MPIIAFHFDVWMSYFRFVTFQRTEMLVSQFDAHVEVTPDTVLWIELFENVSNLYAKRYSKIEVLVLLMPLMPQFQHQWYFS